MDSGRHDKKAFNMKKLIPSCLRAAKGFYFISSEANPLQQFSISLSNENLSGVMNLKMDSFNRLVRWIYTAVINIIDYEVHRRWARNFSH